ncbi:hypothetical protein HanRHA438_Chr05g0223031 [Helianthus annuus]|uniref:Uncharacterized protein n=1 Tax=Helianthus annuus TaxID=4232 RepID=A0A251UPE4_HELAN|nr:hypothetical protein HanXRQr2_Chr05g0213671 [Helianthus annuus]KAJ0584502.1 hypothetical protein HanHA89_Chr05g0189371 [Helianthus annuus]KAJ0918873.1 hypothetical protein HanRHA438_Chr05g0223031 [Helianthus annuus]KAJ0922669.1 hypothetical protein HanPSC8_Chr05g0206571 [Helianthus annuus]
MAAMVVGCLPGLILLFCCCFKLEKEFFLQPYAVDSGVVEDILIRCCLARSKEYPRGKVGLPCMTSDYDAISIIFDVHRYAKTPKDAVAEVVKAGDRGWTAKKYKLLGWKELYHQ